MVRVSGPDLGPFIIALLGRPLAPRQASYLAFPDANGDPIDRGIAIYFHGPHSYTGEDVLELQAHGGPAVLRQLLRRCLDLGRDHGMRLAQAGEFTQRAYLNDKIDLAQAEAVADLIDASSEAAARAAASSLSGEFSRRINALGARIVELRMLVEATLDFPEEELEFLEKHHARDRLVTLQSDLDDILRQSRQGLVLREGLHVVLAGEPNVGKSSLLNALSGEDIAIVTEIAGTTRDKVSQQLLLQGVPMTVTDTAGLRDTQDRIESLGIERTWAEIRRADVILHLLDARSPLTVLDAQIDAVRARKSVVLQVFTKVDLLDESPVLPEGALAISAKQGAGLDQLRERLLQLAGWNPGSESPWLARQRHVDALEQASLHLARAMEHARLDDRVLDLFAEELRLAHDSLGLITGKMLADELLGEIFSRFCIGK